MDAITFIINAAHLCCKMRIAKKFANKNEERGQITAHDKKNVEE